jgi:peptide/nickel transport system permease protein
MGSRIARLVGRRLLQAIPVILIVAVGIFVLLELASGDAVDAYLAGTGGGDVAFAERLRADWGLDRSLATRFLVYVESLATLDFGRSVAVSMPVGEAIAQRLPITLLMMGSAVLLSAALGSVLGGIAALNRGRLLDGGITIVGLVLNAMPNFWLGLLFMVAFVVKQQWFPLAGIATIDGPSDVVGRAADVAWHLVLPVLTLALTYMALYLRLMRGAMIETQASDWVRAARARGLPRGRVIRRHIARPALLPVVTMLGLQTGNLLGGSVVIETVFSIPGLGSLAYEAVRQRDLPLIAGILLAGTLLVIAVNLLVDLAYAWLDPRVADARTGGWRTGG